ncbi:cyclin [Penicillium canescens]|uniref:cyclin n=1 Tax=Penicillium canescens TaxID=5083 RepID=UPI0026E02927|nr:cyclin [Penicillium canescens]KAJ6050609.1 cyclin [Penicillium canescens]KAJ6065828.1 cyclin [Penicillium canescens]
MGLKSNEIHSYRQNRGCHESESTSVAIANESQSHKRSKMERNDNGLRLQNSPSAAKRRRLAIPLPEFVAQVAHLLWFEKTSTLQAIEARLQRDDKETPLQIDEKATLDGQFLKWVISALSATRFIHKLRTSHPGMGGRAGTEVMILTVALMLGNKCEFYGSQVDGLLSACPHGSAVAINNADSP